MGQELERTIKTVRTSLVQELERTINAGRNKLGSSWREKPLRHGGTSLVQLLERETTIKAERTSLVQELERETTINAGRTNLVQEWSEPLMQEDKLDSGAGER